MQLSESLYSLGAEFGSYSTQLLTEAKIDDMLFHIEKIKFIHLSEITGYCNKDGYVYPSAARPIVFMPFTLRGGATHDTTLWTGSSGKDDGEWTQSSDAFVQFYNGNSDAYRDACARDYPRAGIDAVFDLTLDGLLQIEAAPPPAPSTPPSSPPPPAQSPPAPTPPPPRPRPCPSTSAPLRATRTSRYASRAVESWMRRRALRTGRATAAARPPPW